MNKFKVYVGDLEKAMLQKCRDNHTIKRNNVQAFIEFHIHSLPTHYLAPRRADISNLTARFTRISLDLRGIYLRVIHDDMLLARYNYKKN